LECAGLRKLLDRHRNRTRAPHPTSGRQRTLPKNCR
jgi:hypothetical protein